MNFFYNQIKDDIYNWSDFELALGMSTFSEVEKASYIGDYLGELTETDIHKEKFKEKHFIQSIKEFRADFRLYLKEQERIVKIPNIKNSLLTFIDELKDGDRETVRNRIRMESINYNFLNFNYTTLLDSALGETIGNVYHVHETIDEGAFLGVNDRSQINIKKISERNLKVLIKPEIIAAYNKNRISKLDNVIEESDIIIVFGMSFGKTDMRWWEKILGVLHDHGSKILIVHDYKPDKKMDKADPFSYLEEEGAIKDLILQYKIKNNRLKSIMQPEETEKEYLSNDSIENQVMAFMNSEKLFKDEEETKTPPIGIPYEG